jgi:hypothetical protein
MILSVCCILLGLHSFGQANITKIPYDNIMENIKQLLPANWTVLKDAGIVIHLLRNDSMAVCNFINADDPHDKNWEEYIKEKKIGKLKYDLQITIKQRLPESSIKAITKSNDSINKLIIQLPQKYNISHLSHKYNDYIYHTETEKQNVLKYKEEYDQLTAMYVKLPDFNTNLYSIYMSDNQQWYASFCYPENEKEVWDLRKKVENYLCK